MKDRLEERMAQLVSQSVGVMRRLRRPELFELLLQVATVGVEIIPFLRLVALAFD